MTTDDAGYAATRTGPRLAVREVEVATSRGIAFAAEWRTWRAVTDGVYHLTTGLPMTTTGNLIGDVMRLPRAARP